MCLLLQYNSAFLFSRRMNFITRVLQASCSTASLPCRRRWHYVRYYSSGSEPLDAKSDEEASTKAVSNPNSLFSPDDSAWDRVFANLDDYKARSLPSRRDMVPKRRRPSQGQLSRRQAMTAREINAFDEIFNMIFNAAAKHESSDSVPASGSPQVNTFGDIFASLRLNSKSARWTTEQDEFLDRKKEEVDLCSTDVELLHWVQREVLDAFTDSQKTSERDDNIDGSTPPSPHPSKALHIQTYSQLVAYLMRTFREKYRDPHLALALFDQVRHRSLISYVFGCSAQVYNELIETKWACFRDLRGVHDALEEMVVNGVAVDARTRKLVEVVRRQVGDRTAWTENLDISKGEVWNLLLRLDHYVAKSTSLKKKDSKWDQWKKQPLTDKDADGWAFGQWSGTAQG
ncbi:hypothetical protein M378DRAFT_184752 [Amanita muscaria Koide BX008]|uniref:Mtf2-like C-terminal domain-containing protein n=1 Tax=Amanita muscaria (strain Koide BX008) TaxID=946122 RepID=A0A0C2X3V7_AMAMK|nr:hypothetical protein M378DRAFT_184752 [Amanita muscaria Koide BX008]